MSAVVTGPFGDCKNAILQHIDHVQASGALVAIHLDSDLIEYCSANSAEFLGMEPTELLGRTGSEWLSAQRSAVYSIASQESRLGWRNFAGADPLVVIGHRQGAHMILEFERAPSASQPHWWDHAARTRFAEQLTAVNTAEDCREFLVRWVFELSGYDRVMMYRFRPDWHGDVVDERCRPGVEGFYGFRFPASDIPPNARQMFTLNRQRAIVDVDTVTSPVLRLSEDIQPLDLTYSTLRAAHPVHVQYLKNMGVQASLTLSTVVKGDLWGLIACHHMSPRAPSVADRLAFEEMSRLVSLHLTNLVRLIEQQMRSHLRQQLSRLQGAMSATGDNAKPGLTQNLGMLRQTFGAGGAWLRFEGRDFFAGLVPDKLSLAPLRDFLELFPREQISHYDALPEALQPYPLLSLQASGALFVPLGSADFIALLRPEVIETVNWAGKPDTENDNPGITRPLTPRESFATWSQQVRNTAEPWTETELEFAEKLRADLLSFLSTARLEQIALHDPLTGLANRLLFERRLQQEVRNSVARNSSFAVYMIDLDRFKQVNDNFGHAAGDRLLVEVAERLTSLVRRADTVARLGGDEFAILLGDLANKADAVSMAKKIVHSVCPAYQIGGHTAEVGASVGVAIWPSDTVEEGELLEYADLALYKVKRAGKNAFSMYAPEMRIAESSSTSGERLPQALRDDEFKMNYQPIVDARSGELRGLEAFLRWHPPGMGIMQASELMPQVEKQRLGPAVGEWVMNAVFRQYQEWLRQGLPLVPISVNVGNTEFATQDLLGMIQRLGAHYQTGWQWLRLDITEQAVIADVGHAIRKLAKLREAGVGANLDIFGRAFVPLGYLTQLPFRGIKLDAVLFENNDRRQHFQAVVNVVQSIAKVFSAELTVTRIETLEMREMLNSHHIHRLQGHAIAWPAEAAQAVEWLRDPARFIKQVVPSLVVA